MQLTHVQFVLLAAVWWLSDQAAVPSQLPSQRQVADHAATDVMMTSQVLRALEIRGLVTRALVFEAADAGFFKPVEEPAHFIDELSQLADEPSPGQPGDR